MQTNFDFLLLRPLASRKVNYCEVYVIWTKLEPKLSSYLHYWPVKFSHFAYLRYDPSPSLSIPPYSAHFIPASFNLRPRPVSEDRASERLPLCQPPLSCIELGRPSLLSCLDRQAKDLCPAVFRALRASGIFRRTVCLSHFDGRTLPFNCGFTVLGFCVNWFW